MTLNPRIGNETRQPRLPSKDNIREQTSKRSGDGFFNTTRDRVSQFPGLTDRQPVALPGLRNNEASPQRPNKFADLNRDTLRQQIDATGDSQKLNREKFESWRQRQKDDRARTPERRKKLEDQLSEVDRDQWRDRRDDIREDRQDFRKDRQDDWQQFRKDSREDWQNWYDDKYYYHYGWYRGGWHYGWDRYWQQMWKDYPAAVAVGLTCWGINSMSYSFGTVTYVNPYYTGQSTGSATDYSQAQFTTAKTGQTGPNNEPPQVPDQGLAIFEKARVAFHSGDYAKARELADKALASMPRDALVQEFRALTFYAQQMYKDAATVLHSVLAVSPGWDWTTMSQLYPSLDVYTSQLRDLEHWTKEHPSNPEGHFVLAYHYLTCGHQDSAAKQLRLVVQLLPDDNVSARLLEQLTGNAPQPTDTDPATEVNNTAATSDTTNLNATTVRPEQIKGTWLSASPDYSYRLEIRDDGRFAWTYKHNNQSQMVSGVYALKDSTLAMEPDDGGVMLADLQLKNGRMTFQQVGTDTTIVFTHE